MVERTVRVLDLRSDPSRVRRRRRGPQKTLASRMKVESYHAGIWSTTKRLLVWTVAATYFGLGILGDKLARRDTTARRARRLRQMFEGLGATFVKVGQQLAIRIDLLPYEYSVELSKMLDKVPPFPLDQARPRIAGAAGCPIDEMYREINPKPIGSGSVACVYPAVLRDGTKVAVKVRRPRIGEMFAADMRALGWMFWLLELFVLPPGSTKHLVFELSTMLYEELDFAREARYTELFRTQIKEYKPRLSTAPRVYFSLSSNDVLVTELVSGVWFNDLLRVVETNDEEELGRLADMGIRPDQVARHLLRSSWLQGQESWFFHADLHPANLLVNPGGKITFIDFGSCGTFTEKDRRVWRQLLFAQATEDINGMVQASLALLEPLPHIDVHAFSRRLEVLFWADFYAHKSHHAEWWERTSANLWIGFLKLSREYEIPMNLNTLRMIRATMLSDTLAARLYPQIDHYAEYRKFQEATARQAQQRLMRKVGELDKPTAWRRYEALFDLFGATFYRAQRFLDDSSVAFGNLENSTYYALGQIMRAVFHLGVMSAAIGVGVTIYKFAIARGAVGLMHVIDAHILSLDGWREIVANVWYLLLVAVVSLAAARRILIRFDQKQED
jgi:ubiquinone biosynthesis protein